ncbi:hypothetical protein HMPREF1871_01213 [Gemelliphila asaccharolytica]|uniref:Uncharacterized protein n=1 Tax=Gemelliphila asaccharolytica TaxID=502393 RepID=A0ABR5TKD5_9BACL|nr:hypothetical protein HMPREF1871_01213 [Gemella asaccharolytica]
MSSKLLKAKEEIKSQDKDKKSILRQIKSFKAEDKVKSNKEDHSKDIAKMQRDKYRQSSDCFYFF